MLNVNEKIEELNKYITKEQEYVKYMKEIRESISKYQVNFMINILTIVTTIYSLICLITNQWNTVVFVIGAVILLVAWLFVKKIDAVEYKNACLTSSCIVGMSVLFFMVIKSAFPLVGLAIGWGYAVTQNLKLKKKISNIAIMF